MLDITVLRPLHPLCTFCLLDFRKLDISVLCSGSNHALCSPQWFATKSDLILLLFDPHKLDISDEFKRVIMSLRGNYDKIRVVLNKADQMETQQVTGSAESKNSTVLSCHPPEAS